MSKCNLCDKRPHCNPKAAIKFQINFNLRFNIQKPFVVYKCYCQKWLVSFRAATEERYKEFMSEYMIDNPVWDDEEMVDRQPEESTGRKHFGKLQLFVLQVTKSFQAGNYVTIPGVVGGNFDDKDETGRKKFKGWTQGGSNRLYVLVATKRDRDGNEYQIVKQYKHKVQKDEPHLWADFVYPSLKALSDSDRNKLLAGTPAKWEEVITGHKAEIDGQEHDIKAWVNFAVHTQESLAKAESEFFAQFEGGNNTQASTDESGYPSTWAGSVPEMLAEVGKQLNEGVEVDVILVNTLLVENGKNTVDNGRLKEILLEGVEAIDVAEPLKSPIKQKVEAHFQ